MAGNIKNLRVPTSEEARENGRKGGLASAKARRKKKAMKELAQIMLDSKPDGKMGKLVEQMGADLDPEEFTNAAAILAGQMISAVKGNTNAARFVAELVDGGTTQKQEQDELSKSLEELGKSL